ncbi:MAG: hypothetical protein JW874_16305 [Spirochaetales bacterium]|nr:hypothetical protein [Spirochaetales bacterium]
MTKAYRKQYYLYMFGFALRKWFYDLWDNMIKIVILNIVLLFAIFGFGSLIPLISNLPAVGFPAVIAALYLLNLLIAAASGFSNEISANQAPGFKEYLAFLKVSFKPAIFITAAIILQILIVVIVIPYYTRMGNVMGILAGGVVFWICLYWWIMMQYFYPVYWQLNRSIIKAVKKSALITLDNTLFTTGMALASVLIFAVSAITAFLVPGTASVFMWHQTAMRLRLLKYDYLEENPGADRKKIPWEVVLSGQRDKVGTRTLRNLIFPWKD